jgi:predicted RNase H-like nuclease (RuvC/YqgF family)
MLEIAGLQLGTFFQFLAAMFSGGTFAAVLAFYVRNRQISVNAEATLRTHFGAELTRLAGEVERGLERQLKCEAREESLRKRVRDLEASDIEKQREIEGLKRQIAQYSANKLLELEGNGRPSQKAPDAAASAPRVQEITGKGEQ